MTSEPTLASESDFQSAVLSAMRDRLEAKAQDGIGYAILEPFGLDAAVLVNSPSGTTLRYLEFKAYSGQRVAGVGFGDPKGKGPQVDLLLLLDSFIRSLNPLIRWCFADLTLPKGERRYSVMTCLDAKQAAMGQIRRGKQNNFHVKRAFADRRTWGELVDYLEGFVLA